MAMLIISLLLSKFAELYKHFIGSPIVTFPYHFVNVSVAVKNGVQLVEYMRKSQISKKVEELMR